MFRSGPTDLACVRHKPMTQQLGCYSAVADVPSPSSASQCRNLLSMHNDNSPLPSALRQDWVEEIARSRPLAGPLHGERQLVEELLSGIRLHRCMRAEPKQVRTWDPIGPLL